MSIENSSGIETLNQYSTIFFSFAIATNRPNLNGDILFSILFSCFFSILDSSYLNFGDICVCCVCVYNRKVLNYIKHPGNKSHRRQNITRSGTLIITFMFPKNELSIPW